MNVRNLAIALSVMSTLAACDKTDSGFKALDLAEGHDAYGAAPKVEALVTEASSSVPPTAAIIPSSSSSEYAAPLTEACNPGDHVVRLWDCDSTGHRSYW